ncbi:hypothetical protein EKO27_g8297 [Xylaria grammica]|uniref:Receptor L-domain domain-containing protein n=1 Tax=Xylaria grammica TaxID=363999 RepID=A0A439CX66_9PEZI|nr:hypothetical protein EKO27_g8297 [Xylaria grammica]
MKLLTSVYALSLAGVALADCGVEGGTTVLANPNFAILDELEACTTIYGDILVDPEFVYLILQGPQEITGTIIAHDNSILKAVSLPDVRKLGGFSFVSPQIDGNVNFPEVTEIGFLEWKYITFRYEFDYFGWGAPKLTKVSNLNVESTDLSGLTPDDQNEDGFYTYDGLPYLETADNIRVVNNVRMNEIVLPGLKAVSGSVVVGNNIDVGGRTGGKRDGGNLLVSFPALESAGNVVVYDDEPYRGALEGKIDLPVLNHVFGDLNFTNIEKVTEINVPGLTDIDGGLYILNNRGLFDLEFPELRRVDHVVIDGQDTDDGGFKTISFPALEEVGSFHVHSPAYVFDCSSLDHIREIASDFSCSNIKGPYNPDTPSSSSSVPTPLPSSSEPVPTSVSSPITDPFPTSEPSDTTATTAADQTGQTNQTSVPATTTVTEVSEPTKNPDATEDTGPSPTDEDAPNTSESSPAMSGTSTLKPPFARIALLFRLLRR